MSFRRPDCINKIKDATAFDPKKHFDLKKPEQIWRLEDFGYTAEQAKQLPFPLAVTSHFKILSAEGLKVMRDSINQIMDQKRSSDRMANYIRGAVFYSDFIRDFCYSPELNGFMEELAGKPIMPHPMRLYQAHINLKPEEAGRDVDRWHTDTVALDFVLLLTDPSTFEGGYFEYFQCTKGKAIRALIRDEVEPNVIKVEFPEAGYGVLQQGDRVVHRASEVTKGDERTTLVQSYIPQDPLFKDISKLDDCKLVDRHDVLFTEWARYKALLSQRKLDHLIQNIPFSEDRFQIVNELRKAIRDVEEAILEISDDSQGRLSYLGQDALTDLL
jgi:hypothetical protein